jgi:hypothetical protein
MAFYYLPEDREREAKLHAKEMQELRDKRANAKYPQDKTSILVRQLRSAINGACPKHLSERQVIRRQFALFDEDKSGVVDYKEFKLAIKKYMNGVEEKDILDIFQHFDKDNSKTLSVEEFMDLLLKETGPHNFSYKEYNKSKPNRLRNQDKNSNAPSSRPHSGASNWTRRVRGEAGKPYSKTSDVTTNFSISQTSRTSQSTNYEKQKDIRFAHRAFGGANQSTNTKILSLILEEKRILFKQQIRKRIISNVGKEGSTSNKKKQKKQQFSYPPGNTLYWVLKTYANASSTAKDRPGRIGKRRFAASMDTFRGKTQMDYDLNVLESIWEICNKGKIIDIVRYIFPDECNV